MQYQKFLIFIWSRIKLQKTISANGENKKYFYCRFPRCRCDSGKSLPNIYNVKKRYEIKFNNYAIGILHPITTNLKNLKKTKIFLSLVKSG